MDKWHKQISVAKFGNSFHSCKTTVPQLLATQAMHYIRMEINISLVCQLHLSLKLKAYCNVSLLRTLWTSSKNIIHQVCIPQLLVLHKSTSHVLDSNQSQILNYTEFFWRADFLTSTVQTSTFYGYKMFSSYKWCTCDAGWTYLSAFVRFSFFLPLPGKRLAVSRGRALPPLALLSTDTICKSTPSQLQIINKHVQQCLYLSYDKLECSNQTGPDRVHQLSCLPHVLIKISDMQLK